MTDQPANNPALQAALEYAAQGLPVFPVHSIGEGGACTCGRPCADPGKHPRIRTGAGLRNASTNADTIRGWWERWPDSNIGIAIPEGLLVVDLDGADGWTFAATQNHMPPTWCAFTGGGGIHYWYSLPKGLQARNGAGLRPGVDLRAAGGYVVAPPGKHASGGEYAWAFGQAPAEGPVAEAPAWAVELVKEQNRRPADAATIGDDRDEIRGILPDRIPASTRNESLFRHGCRLRARGADEARILEELLELNTTRCAPEGLPRPEVEKTARSAAKYGQGEPRLDNRILSARGLSVRAKLAAALVALKGADATNAELGAVVGVNEDTVGLWRAELRAAGLEALAIDRPLRNYTRVPLELLTREGLSPGARVLGIVMAHMADDDGRAQAGIKALAAHLEAGESTVRRWSKELQGAGVVAVNRALFRGNLGRRDETNKYRLLVGQEQKQAQARPRQAPNLRRNAESEEMSGRTIATTRGPLSWSSAVGRTPRLYMRGAVAVAVGGRGGGGEVENPPDRPAKRPMPSDADLPEFLRGTTDQPTHRQPTADELARELFATSDEVRKLLQRGYTVDEMRLVLQPAV